MRFSSVKEWKSSLVLVKRKWGLDFFVITAVEAESDSISSCLLEKFDLIGDNFQTSCKHHTVYRKKKSELENKNGILNIALI